MDFYYWKYLLAVFSMITLISCTQDNLENIAITTVDDNNSAEKYFPLSDGAYWIYQGTVTWEDAGEIRSETLNWKMEVVEVIDRGEIVGYRMLGHPGDLAWYEDGKKRSDYAIIQAGSGSYYLSDLHILERLKDDNDLLDFLVNEEQLFLDTPLSPGKRICGAAFITNPYGDYCWVVGPQENVTLGNVVEDDESKLVTGYTIRYVTNPDHTIITFVPGLGITNYVYGHHGVLSEVDLELIEYSIGR